MAKAACLAVVLGLLLASVSVEAARKAGGPVYSPTYWRHYILVKFKPGTGANAPAVLAQQFAAALEKWAASGPSPATTFAMVGADLQLKDIYGTGPEAAKLAATQMHAGGSIDFPTRKALLEWYAWLKGQPEAAMWRTRFARIMEADTIVPFNREVPGGKIIRSITLEKPMLMNGSAAAWPAVSTLLDGQYAAIEAQPVPPLQSQAGVDLGLGPLTHGRKAGSNAAVACASDFAVEMHARAVIKEVERASLRHAGESARLQLMVQY